MDTDHRDFFLMCVKKGRNVTVIQHANAYGYLTVFNKHLIILSKGLLTQLVFHKVMSALFFGNNS